MTSLCRKTNVIAVLLMSIGVVSCASQQAEIEPAPDPAVNEGLVGSTEPVTSETPVDVVEPDITEPASVEPVTPEAQPTVSKAQPQSYDRDDVVWIQGRLKDLGYYDGPVDGSAGSVTRNAIQDYQRDQGVRADGQPTAELREFMWRNGG